jgi:periplasmic divalent cation tolerance protein
MDTPPYIVLLITTANDEEAHRISTVLLEKKKAACVNIVPRVDSLFWWQGKLDSGIENLLIVKTKAHLLNEIIALVKESHSYETPEVIALPIIGGSQEYLQWIEKEVK